MERDQEHLFTPKEWKPEPFLDFAGLPSGVYPTTLKALGQGQDTLFYRVADASKKITSAQHRLFSTIVRNTSHPDANGTAQVVVVTGIPGKTTRTMAVYDHINERPHLVPCHDEDIQRFVQQWFHSRQGRR